MLEGAISVVSESIEMTLDAQRMFILARLTWFEYSWDIMEPITYFTTYATVIAGFAYYVATRQVSNQVKFSGKLAGMMLVFQSYEYPLAKERQLWILFHRKAKKSQFDTVKYDRLVEEIRMVESELRRLRDPLFLHLPIGRLQSLHGDLVKDNENITN